MADLRFQVASGESALTASTARSLIVVTAPGNQRVKVLGVEIFGKGTVSTDTPIKCELMTFTSVGSGTPGSVTSSKLDGDLGETIQSTVAGNFTAEPTYGGNVTVRTWEVQPQTGLAIYFPLDQEIKLKGGTGFALRCTSGQSETISVNCIFEE